MRAIAIRVFASHPVAVAQYTRVLAAEKDFRLVSGDEPFHVGVFDVESPSAQAMLTLARLKFPSMRPLLLTSSCDENESLRWLFRGLWGLVTYDQYEEDLPRVVRQIAEGQLWFPAPVVLRWMKMDASRRASALRLPLTKREHEIMEFLLRRFSNKEIADILGVSQRTVKFHVGNIFHKLHVNSRQELSASWVPGWEET